MNEVLEVPVAMVIWALFGLIVGSAFRALFPAGRVLGHLAVSLWSVLGAVVGGLSWWVLTEGRQEPYHPASWVLAVVGAVAAVWIYVALVRRGKT